MSKLDKIQQNFIDSIYDNDDKIFSFIKKKIAPKSRLLAIYQNNLYGVLIEALRITYKYLNDFLSTKEFEDLAKKYIRKYRSQSGNLDDYGADFADFLLSQKNQFYHDLAKISWLEQLSYLAEDEPDFDIEALQKLDSEKLFDVKFKMSKSCFLFQSDYSLFAKKNREEKRKRKSYYIIYRHFLEVKTIKINQKEYLFLDGVKQNLTLFEIYEKYNCDIEKSLQNYIGNGVLKSFSV